MTTEDNQDRENARRQAITEAEVQDIVRALAPFGVLGRDALAEEAHALTWQEGDFDVALDAAVRGGVVEKLAGGFYKLVR